MISPPSCPGAAGRGSDPSTPPWIWAAPSGPQTGAPAGGPPAAWCPARSARLLPEQTPSSRAEPNATGPKDGREKEEMVSNPEKNVKIWIILPVRGASTYVCDERRASAQRGQQADDGRHLVAQFGVRGRGGGARRGPARLTGRGGA